MTRRHSLAGFALAVVVGLAVPFACNDEVINTAVTGTSSSSGSGTGAAGVGGETGATTSSTLATTGFSSSATAMCAPGDPACHPILTCHGHVYQCGDGTDNDGDGLIDMDDPSCTGPCDNDEAGFFPNVPGQQAPACKVDCFFGPHVGNDGCYWSHECDPLELAPSYYPESNSGAQCAYAGANTTLNPPGKTCAELEETQSAQCLATCGPLTPNGCDCFGCCELPAGTSHYVWLGSTNPAAAHCTSDKLLDPTFCQPCTPVAGCLKKCDKCDICIGKPVPDEGCTSNEQCPTGVQPCGLPGLSVCAAGTFCNTGCCYALPP